MPETTHSPDTFPVVVIGAGLAGLTAAVHLAERGIPPLVLEANTEWAGGRLQGGAPDEFEHQGRKWSFASEHGMHALWGDYDNMRGLIKRFAPMSLRISEGEEWINRWGRDVRHAEAGSAVRATWLPAPFHYLQLLLLPAFWPTITLLDLFSLPGFLVSILLTVGFDPIREQVAWDGLMMDEYFRGWTPTLRAPIVGLARNLLAAPSEAITLTGLMAALRFFTLLRRASWWPAYLPDNAHRCLVRPLIRQIEERGGGVILGARAAQLARVEGGWRVTVEEARRGRRSVRAERVILAVDPPAAKQLLTGSPDTAEIAARLRFPPGLPGATVRLWYDCDARPGSPGGMFSGDFVPDNFFWLHRLRPDFQEWHEATGGGCIEMHLYALSEVLNQPDKALLTTAVGEAQLAFPELRGHFVHGVVRHNEASQTQFLVPNQDSLWVETPWPGVGACGDWIGCDTPALWMERCVITGIEAANVVIRGHGGEPFPIIPPRRPELLVIVLGGIVRGLRKIIGPVVFRVARQRRDKTTRL